MATYSVRITFQARSHRGTEAQRTFFSERRESKFFSEPRSLGGYGFIRITFYTRSHRGTEAQRKIFSEPRNLGGNGFGPDHVLHT